GNDLRSGGRIQVCLDHGVAVTLLHQLRQHFLPDLSAIALTHDLRRDLPRTKALDPDRAAYFPKPRLDLFFDALGRQLDAHAALRSEEHTSELQSRENLVCRL